MTTDPATLGPTNKLDPRAIAWLQSLGVIQKETLEVFQNSYQSKLMGIKLSFSRQKRDFRLRYTVHAVRQFCMLSIFDFGCGDFKKSSIYQQVDILTLKTKNQLVFFCMINWSLHDHLFFSSSIGLCKMLIKNIKGLALKP